MNSLRTLRRRLAIESPQRTPDGSGGWTETWVAAATVWAGIETLSGREAVRAEAVTAEATHRITIRFRGDVGTAMRFRDATRMFEIVGVLQDEKRRWITCLCRERPAA